MPDRSPRASRRWLYIPFAIAGVILVGYYALWRAGAHELKKAVAVWVEDQRALGLEVFHGDIQTDGFPFFLRAHVATPTISSPNAWRWQGETLAIDTLPYELNRLIFSPGGEQLVSADGLGEWRGSADDLRLSIANDKERGWVLAMTVGQATGVRTDDGASYSLGALVLDLAPAPNDPTTLTVNLAASDMTLDIAGETYSAARLQTALALSKTHMLSGSAPAQSWRNADGELKIGHFFAEIEAAAITAAGDIRLDQDLYPEGALKAEIEKPAGLAMLLQKTGALTSKEAEAAAAGLSLMAITSGGKISAPIKLENGAAQIAGIKIADLSKVE